MFLYRPFKENVSGEVLEAYLTYGIQALQDGYIVDSISDVSANEAFVTELCELCTRLQLHPIHLIDVIEDSL